MLRVSFIFLQKLTLVLKQFELKMNFSLITKAVAGLGRFFIVTTSDTQKKIFKENLHIISYSQTSSTKIWSIVRNFYSYLQTDPV